MLHMRQVWPLRFRMQNGNLETTRRRASRRLRPRDGRDLLTRLGRLRNYWLCRRHNKTVTKNQNGTTIKQSKIGGTTTNNLVHQATTTQPTTSVESTKGYSAHESNHYNRYYKCLMQGHSKQQHQEQLHYLLLDSGVSTHVCPSDYAPDIPSALHYHSATLHGHKQANTCLRNQVRALSEGQFQDNYSLLRL